MWRWFWEEHRSQFYAVAGVLLFLLSGMAVTFLSPMRGPEGGGRQPQEAEEPAPAHSHRESVPTSESTQNSVEDAASLVQLPVPQPEAKADWYLYITGSVRKPGVYKLPPDSRVFQLVDAAGGFDGFADRVAVNMAEPLMDGQHIHIPRKGEEQLRTRREENPRRDEVVVLPPGFSDSSLNLSFRAPATQESGGLIDINQASAEVLVRLRGIGPALAQRIVEYRRQHGPFHSVEELVQVRGIGAAKVRGLRKQATVGP